MDVEKAINVSEALKILRKQQGRITRKGSRSHLEAEEEAVAKIRALEGICGQCSQINPKRVRLRMGRNGVRLRCRARQTPTFLYLDTPLGVIPNCDHSKSSA